MKSSIKFPELLSIDDISHLLISILILGLDRLPGSKQYRSHSRYKRLDCRLTDSQFVSSQVNTFTKEIRVLLNISIQVEEIIDNLSI